MKNKNGFTLIELLVAISIGAVLIGIGAVSLNRFNEQQKIESVRQEVLSYLRLARNYGINNKLPNGADKVVTSVDAEGLINIGFKNAVGNIIISPNDFSKDITPKGVGITFNPSEIQFTVTDGRSIGGSAVVTVSGFESNTKKIKIDESGLIYEE